MEQRTVRITVPHLKELKSESDEAATLYRMSRGGESSARWQKVKVLLEPHLNPTEASRGDMGIVKVPLQTIERLGEVCDVLTKLNDPSEVQAASHEFSALVDDLFLLAAKQRRERAGLTGSFCPTST